MINLQILYHEWIFLTIIYCLFFFFCYYLTCFVKSSSYKSTISLKNRFFHLSYHLSKESMTQIPIRTNMTQAGTDASTILIFPFTVYTHQKGTTPLSQNQEALEYALAYSSGGALHVIWKWSIVTVYNIHVFHRNSSCIISYREIFIFPHI